MATTRKTARKIMSAKKRTAPGALPRTLPVRVRYSAGAYNARARGAACSSTAGDSIAVRGLARKLGYSVHADVRYVRAETLPDTGERVTHFEIVEVLCGR